MNLTRRKFTKAAVACAAIRTMPAFSAQGPTTSFPKGFLWGAATAGHQIEGNDANSDFWFLENLKPTLFAEPVGDACNSFALWPADLDLVKTIGLNSYRFSLEWSRIEPEPGLFSIAMLDHYKHIVDGCRQRGLKPIVTFSHWTVPIWFAAQGGWTHPDSSQLFARYCEKASLYLAAGIEFAITLNEPDGLNIANRMVPDGAKQLQRAMLAEASRKTGVKRFVGGPAFAEAAEMQPNLLKGHREGFQAIKSVRGDLPTGFSLAIVDEQPVGENSTRDEMRHEFYGGWLDTAKNDDFVGIQNYTRHLWDAKGLVDPPAGARMDQVGAEFFPASLANSARYVHQVTGRPILVSEHGIATENDAERVELIRAALPLLLQAMQEGVPVLGYIHWSLLDNFEWASGYRPKYGLAAVDHQTFRRTLKPSATVLGTIARRNAL